MGQPWALSWRQRDRTYLGGPVLGDSRGDRGTGHAQVGQPGGLTWGQRDSTCPDGPALGTLMRTDGQDMPGGASPGDSHGDRGITRAQVGQS